MTCEDVQMQLTESLEVSASPEVESHIQDCDMCRSELANRQALHERLLAAGIRAQSPALADAVMARLEGAVIDTRRSLRLKLPVRWMVGVAAAVAIVVGIGALPWGPHNGSSGLALADVAQRVGQTRSVAFKLRMEVDGKTAMSGELIDTDRKSTRLNSSHLGISYAVFCLKQKKQNKE